MFESHCCRGRERASHGKWHLSWALENGGSALEKKGIPGRGQRICPNPQEFVPRRDVLRDWTSGTRRRAAADVLGEAGGANEPLESTSVGASALPRNSISLVMGLALGIHISNKLPWQ